MLKRMLFYLSLSVRGLVQWLLRILAFGFVMASLGALFMRGTTWPYCVGGVVVAFALYCLGWFYDELILKIQPDKMNIRLL